MKRPAEKTLGPSPEYTPPPKRVRLSRAKPMRHSATTSIPDPSTDDVQVKKETELLPPLAEKPWNDLLGPLLGIDKSGDLTLINQWPDPVTGGIDGTSKDKVPTELQLMNNHYKWGSQIASNAKRLQWFKLGLDATAQPAPSTIAEEFPDQRATTPDDEQSPQVLATEYLRALREHFLAVLKARLPASVFSTTPIEYVLTVPAIWSPAAVETTKICAQDAGMGKKEKLRIVSEPEAAAIWSLHRIADYDPKVGDIFVVCDAGGGTVDLISYEITALRPILRVTEAVPGHGHVCGSTLLNRRFETFLRGRLGGHESWDEEMLEEAMERFDTKVSSGANPEASLHNPLIQIKREYGGSLTQEYHIPVPGFPDSPAHDVDRARFYLKGSNLFNIFEPLILQIVGLVRQQIDATKARVARVRAVLMVGGFGENSYLKKRVEEAVTGDGIEVWKPSFGWTAVVRGALMKALADIDPKSKQISIEGRVARAFYGTESAKEFKDAIHPKEQRIWSRFNGRYEVNTYDWFVQKVNAIPHHAQSSK
ncbi:MAG: hypothetical protein Q9208_008301 [Pyrenodesmia sp. 3 TL-2023]